MNILIAGGAGFISRNLLLKNWPTNAFIVNMEKLINLCSLKDFASLVEYGSYVFFEE